MKDLGLVSVWGKGKDIRGPVAVLLKDNAGDFFVGAYIADTPEGELVLEIFPENFVGPTIWPRNYPSSEKVLKKVAALDAVSGCLLKNKSSKMCSNCGKEIPAERLEALPATLVCVKCSQEINGGRSSINWEDVAKERKRYGVGSNETSVPTETSTHPEVLAVKANLASVMGKYEQIVKKPK